MNDDIALGLQDKVKLRLTVVVDYEGLRQHYLYPMETGQVPDDDEMAAIDQRAIEQNEISIGELSEGGECSVKVEAV